MNLGIARAAVFVLASAIAGRSADPPGFRADSDFVFVGASVVDPQDHPVRGLTRADFRLFDDQVEQTIAYFGEQDVPLSLAVVFDTSGSMSGKLALMRRALGALLAESYEQDEFTLVRFADRAAAAVPWTADAGQIRSAVFSRPASGRTSLWDAVHAALAQFQRAHNPRRAMVIFSDGGDNFSRYSQAQISSELVEAGVQVYAIDTSEPPAAVNRNTDEMPVFNPLAAMCGRAGGRYYQLAGLREAQTVAQRIGRELRAQYLLGFTPSRELRDGKLHNLKVRVKRPEGSPRLSVFWRRGYRAPLF